MASDLPLPSPPVDDALAELMNSPEFQAQMAALTQQATAQLNALVEALRQFETSLPLPVDPIPAALPAIDPPAIDLPAPMDAQVSDDTVSIPFGNPVVDWQPVFVYHGVDPWPVDHLPLDPLPPDPVPPGQPMPHFDVTPAPPVTDAPDMAALTRQAAAQAQALADALRALGDIGAGGGTKGTDIVAEAEQATAWLAQRGGIDLPPMLSAPSGAPDIVTSPYGLAASAAAGVADVPGSSWTGFDFVRHGAEGGNT